MSDNRILTISGRAIPKLANDQNTDDIVPARFLKEITFKRMGEYAYFDERFDSTTGSPIIGHPFNESSPFKGGSILLAGGNYGCGSSREHAPQALYRFGIKGIIAPSFAEIFAGNCLGVGLVGVTATPEDISTLAQVVNAHPETVVNIDLGKKKVSYLAQGFPGGAGVFDVDLPEGRRRAFMEGMWDVLGVLKSNNAKIDSAASRLPYLNF